MRGTNGVGITPSYQPHHSSCLSLFGQRLQQQVELSYSYPCLVPCPFYPCCGSHKLCSCNVFTTVLLVENSKDFFQSKKEKAFSFKITFIWRSVSQLMKYFSLSEMYKLHKRALLRERHTVLHQAFLKKEHEQSIQIIFFLRQQEIVLKKYWNIYAPKRSILSGQWYSMQSIQRVVFF